MSAEPISLSEQKQRLLARRLAARAPAATRALAPIPPRPPGPPPLSAGQAALLYEHGRRPDQATYNVVHCYVLRGPLDLDRLGHAILAAAARHEPLRTSLGSDRRTLEVSEAAHVVEVVIDNAEDLDALARSEATRRFDLESGPLLRATIARFADDAHDDPDGSVHGLVLATHHVSSDAASLANLWADIDLAYSGRPLLAHGTTYSDHAVWQASRRTDDDRRFWADHLGADPQPVSLPLAPPVPAEPDGYLTVPLGLDSAALAGAGLRPIPFFLAMYAALLTRYTDGDDAVVGLAASTRDHPDVGPLVGYFLTIAPLRLPVDPEATVAELTRSTEAVVAGALAHRHIPYAEIAAALRRRGVNEPDPARVMFVFDDPHQPRLGGCRIESRFVHNGAAVTDLTLFVRPAGDCYEVSAEWTGDRYSRDDVAALVDTYVASATWAATHPSTPWAVSARTFPDAVGPPLRSPLRPVTSLFSAQVSHRPDAPAVRAGEESLDYATLHARASTVALALVGRGVGRGDRVAVFLPRTVDLLVAVLGVQLAGAAYVPVDPAYPDERVGLVLAAATPALTVTDPAGAARLPAPSASVDDLVAEVVEGGLRHLPEIGLDDGAYVIFTSGSTGKPRGVPISHRQLAASTMARLDHYRDPVDTYLLVSSIGFDSSVAGVFWTLATGGELVIATDDEVHDVDALGATIELRRVTHTLMVPSLYRSLLARASDQLGSLRCMIVAGEACPPALVTEHQEALRHTALFNEYGPTEATVWATVARCAGGASPVPIGRAIAGVTLRVVDRWLRPRPPGAAGELAIGGVGVAAGYLDQPEATAAAFVVDPRTGDRFYRTGDLVRRDADDTFVFVGRVDHQLSVGGVRVEPEEIEVVLESLPGVTASIVRTERLLDDEPLSVLAAMNPDLTRSLLRRASRAPDPARALAEELAVHGPGTDVLVAHVEGDGTAGGSILSELADRLPRAVVPAAVEVVTHLARSEHGKVDRCALGPPVRWRRPPDELGAVDPGATEMLTMAWRRILGDPSLGPDSDFFAQGGDSLLAVELVTEIGDRLGRRVPVSALIAGRTPRRLGQLIDTPAVEIGAIDESRRSHVVVLRAHGDRPPLFLLPPGGGNLVVYDPLVRALDERFPVVGFDLPGADHDDELPTSIEGLADTYLPQLRAVAPHGPYRFCGWSFGGVAALELAQRLVAEGEVVELIAMIDTLVPGLQRAGRARAYVDLARDGDARAVAAKAARSVRVRATHAAARAKGRRAAARGEQLTPADRNTWLTLRVDEIVERYRPEPYRGRVVFFSARDTHPWRTTEPWRRLMDNLEVVALQGAHDGPDGLLAPPNAVRIAAEVAARLT